MKEISEEEFIELYKLYLKLHPDEEFVGNIRLQEKDGELVSPNPEQTRLMRNEFAIHVVRTVPEMRKILKMLENEG